MARYWVGGTNTWNATVGTKWATTSGGAGGASVPTSADDVIFDANSGAAVVTTSSCECKNLTFTGFTGTFAGSSTVNIYGGLTLVSGMTYSCTGGLSFYATSGTQTITSGGKTIHDIYISGGGATFLFGDNITITTYAQLRNGTITGNGKNLTAARILIGSGANPTVNMGTGTWKVVGDSGYFNCGTGTTLNCDTSTIEFDNSAVTSSQDFYGGSKTYNIVKLSGSTTKAINFRQSSTISELVIDRSVAAKAITFTLSTTTTITTFTAAVSSTRLITLRSSTITNATITKAGGGTVQAYYMDVDYITGSGATTWYMGNNLTSVDGGHNSQIYFTSPALTNPANAYADDASYATGTSDSGNMYIELSKDGGATWTSSLAKIAIAGEASYTYGAGSTELWGTAFTGDDIDDTSFRLRIKGAFFQEIYKTFGFAITASLVLSGVEIVVKAKWDGTTTSINHIKVKIYYADSSSPITAGSQAFASNGRKNGEGAGTGTGVLVFYDGTAWRACDTGATVQS